MTIKIKTKKGKIIKEFWNHLIESQNLRKSNSLKTEKKEEFEKLRMDSDEAYLHDNISLDDIIVTERHSHNNLLLKKGFT